MLCLWGRVREKKMAKLSKGELTKKDIAAAFKKLMVTKSFESITVNDITETCGLNRLTFYYHFDDKYALLNWIYYNEIVKPFIEDIKEGPWLDSLLDTLRRLDKDRAYYQNALAYDNHEFRTYMYRVMEDMFSDLIGDWVDSDYVDEKEIEFVSCFFAHGTVGMVIDWVENDLKGSPDEMIRRLQDLTDDIQLMLITESMIPSDEGEKEQD